MSSLENKKAYKLRKACAKAQGDYASQVLDPETITAAAAKAAADGFEMVRIRIERPLDLSRTAAAAKLAAVLHREGLAMEWVPRSVLGKENASGCDLTAMDLVVRW